MNKAPQHRTWFGSRNTRWLLLLFGVASVGVAQPVINEIHYDPEIKTDRVEFVELYNPTEQDIDLAGWSLADAIAFTFPPGTLLPAGTYVVVAQDVTAMQRKFPTAWIDPSTNYGPFQGRLSSQGESVILLNAAGQRMDEVDYQLGFPWPMVGATTSDSGATDNSVSIQLMHPGLANDVGGHWRTGFPTPGVLNYLVMQDGTPPAVRRVRVEPEQPQADESVQVSARISDVNGVDSVTFLYQTVDPGHYLHKLDAAYQQNWTALPMLDSGTDGDEVAGDEVFTVQVPAAVQQHRRLVRFRIEAVDGAGIGVTVPYADDPQPNFAYFVYNRIPDWVGAVRPDTESPVVYDVNVLTSVPVYHLISKQADVETATWLEKYGGSDYKWYGTLVVDGRVYDHIRYRARGGVWRYAMGKNMWKFDFNRGHSLQARDDYGKRYDTTWSKLNLSACIQQGNYRHRGEQGMFEAVGFKMFNLMGVPAAKTHWLHLRIIDDADEYGHTQYDGDFWGLYLALEQMDGRFLDEHNLPDGNLYKIEGHNVEEGQASNLGSYGPDDFADFYDFREGYRSGPNPSEAWWRERVDLAGYYSYRCVVEGIHHGDIGYGKNYYFYFNPETDRVSQLPWDLDLTWAENMYGNGRDPFLNEGAIFSQALLSLEYKNRVREFVDLLYNTDQAWQLIDEMAAVIDEPNEGPSMVDADRAMWDFHWALGNDAYPRYLSRPASSKAGQGMFYGAAPSGDFPGMVQLMKDYVRNVTTQTRNWHGQSGLSLIKQMEDPAIPHTPVIRYAGKNDFAVNDLRFATDPFTDPQGAHTFNALIWRLGEVESFSRPSAPPLSPEPSDDQVLVAAEQIWTYRKGLTEPPGSTGAWRISGYDLSTGDWISAPMPIGYGESFVRTQLADMRHGYSTLYLRTPFTVDDPRSIGQLILQARYDDGFVAWINGVPVHAQNVPGYDLAFNATALGNDEQQQFRAFPLAVPEGLLHAGENILAVHLVNMSLTSSSDCFFDATLLISSEPEEPVDTQGRPVVQGRPGYYEVESVWTSGEISAYTPDIQIPAAFLKVGHTYRVRCRMQDTTGRWSHWSAPIQFVPREAATQGVHVDLRITEIMYNPADPESGDLWNNDDFEFIELKNGGARKLDIRGLRFERGITFDFAQAPRQELNPGDVVLVVKNQMAFAERYGPTVAAQVVGTYEGKLANGGERITLTDTYAGVVLDFSYQDNWHVTTDGQGYSLVLKDPFGTPSDQMEDAGRWQASAEPQGSPGQ